MGSINNDHRAFFSITQDTQFQNKIAENWSADSTTGSIEFAKRLDFQRILQSFLMNEWNDMAVESGPGNNEDSSFTLLMLGNNLTHRLPAAESLPSDLLAQSLGSTHCLLPATQLVSKYRDIVNKFLQSGMDAIRSNEESIQDIAGAAASGINPTKRQVMEYIIEQCRIFGIPKELGLATAAAESSMTQFNKDGTPCHSGNVDSVDWGIMQINDKAWGNTFDLNRIKFDWQYNVRAGLQILKDCYRAAIENNEGLKGGNGFVANLARAAYSGYNAGISTIWRYRTPINAAPRTGPYGALNNEGYDLRDQRFWYFYQQFV